MGGGSCSVLVAVCEGVQTVKQPKFVYMIVRLLQWPKHWVQVISCFSIVIILNGY